MVKSPYKLLKVGIMNRFQFLRLNIEQKAMLVNAMLRSGETLTSIAKKFQMARSSLQSPFRAAGFKFDRKNNQYVYDDEVMTNPLTTTEIKERLIRIEELIRRYLANEPLQNYQPSNELIVDIPSGKEIRVTIRVNEKIWQEFNDFCEKRPHFYKKDLLGIALLDFMEEYKSRNIIL